MAKLYFYYGAMNSGKSAQLMMAVHNYVSQGKPVLVLKPSCDTRGKEGTISSRAFSDVLDATCFGGNEEMYDFITSRIDHSIKAIFIDEAQFMTASQVLGVVRASEHCGVPILCYGLKNTYIPGVMFEGAQTLLYYADKTYEIKTVCEYCDSKSTQNMRVINGKPVYSGDTLAIGDVGDGDDVYVPVCKKHFLKGFAEL